MKWIMLMLMSLPSIAQEVTLSLDKYEALRERAKNALEEPVPPPTPFALETVDAEIEVNHHRARIIQTLTVMLYDETWQQIPLPKGSHFIEADFGELNGRISGDGDWVLSLKGKGRHKIRLTSTAMAIPDEQASTPTWRFQWAIPNAARISGSISTSADIEQVGVNDEAVLFPQRDDANYKFIAKPGGTLVVTLKGPTLADDRGDLPLRFQTITTSSTRISRARMEVESILSFRIYQGVMEEIAIPIPPGLEIVSLKANPAANWRQEGRTILVEPVLGLKDRWDLDFSFIAPYLEDIIVPILIPDGAVKPKAFIGIQVVDDGFVQLEDPGSGRRYSGRALLPKKFAEIKGHIQEVKDPARPPKWKVFWAEETRVLAAQVDKMKVEILAGNNGSASYRVWVNVRNVGVPNLEMTLPPGFISTTVTRDDEETLPGGSENRLILPLNTAMDHQLIVVSGIMPFLFPEENGQFSIPLPSLSVPIGTVDMVAMLPGNRTYQLVDKHREGSSGWTPESGSRNQSSLSRSVFKNQSGPVYSTRREWAMGPNSFNILTAHWTTLSSSPEPVAIIAKVRSTKKKEWL